MCTRRPIIPATGEKIFEHGDHVGEGPDALTLVRSFRSSRAMGAGMAAAGLGQTWSHNHATALRRVGAAGTAGSAARILFGGGSVRVFNWSTTSGTWMAANSADTLVANASGLLYKRLDDDSAWQFDGTGKLLTVTQRNGWTTTYSYSTANTPAGIAPAAGLLIAVSNHFGRPLGFTYNGAGQLASVTLPDGRLINYSYDGINAASRLTTVTYPANSGTGIVSKTYLYENASFPQLVTGIVDENANRLATVAYDTQGRATSSGYALNADLYSVSYPASAGAGTTVTDPIGTQRTYNYGTAAGKLAVVGADKPAEGGTGSVANRQQDANGFVTQETDFLGVSTLYTWDINRRLPLTTTRASGLPEAQTRGTQWHNTFKLPVLVTEAGRTTAYTYDGQGNPLTRTVTDTATLASRTTSWTYNGQGLPVTQTDPNGVVTRTHAYYSGTSFSPAQPPGSFDPSMGSVSLLLHGDGANGSTTFTDSSLGSKALTSVGAPKISTAQSKFGASSIFLNGSSYLSVPDPAFLNLGSGDFTMEAWVHPTSVFASYGGTRFAIIAGKDTGTPGSGRSWWLRLYSDATSILYIQMSITGNGTSFESSTGVAAGAAAISLNQWSHIAATRSGGFLRTFVNGILVNETASSAVVQSSTTPVTIGGEAIVSSEAYFPGYIDDLRITTGVARYTANFTPPAQAFPNVGVVLDPSAVGHTAGDLQSTTNALGHVTQFTLYDRAGRVRQMVDPKGIVTDTAYTPRGWTSSVTVTPPGGTARTTSYTYDNAGQLTGATLPDGSTLGYSYDAAHRLTGVTDAKGNSVTYTLDNAGNKTGEQIKDPSGNLQRNITRVYDALNRVQQVTGASN
jgi:YD repeat-containing protein